MFIHSKMYEVELANNNILSGLLVYDIIIVPVVSIAFFFLSGRKFNNLIRLGYFLAIVCIITALLHRYYIWTYTGDTTSGIEYTSNMYVILTTELASFIGFIILITIGFFMPVSVPQNNRLNVVVRRPNNSSYRGIVPK
jgi:hypothetical protein